MRDYTDCIDVTDTVVLIQTEPACILFLAFIWVQAFKWKLQGTHTSRLGPSLFGLELMML